MTRNDGRNPSELRPITFSLNPQRDPIGSVLIEWGHTKVICSVSVEEKLPPWMSSSEGKGWLTAEYSMLPGSSDRRIHRDRVRNNGRTHEIQRLIGRSLRSCVDPQLLGPRTFTVDCDVIQADGGTRVASITGSYLALCVAIHNMLRKSVLKKNPILTQVAAVSVGKVKSAVLTDLDYSEDSQAELDANIVMNAKGEFIELQATAEKGSFRREEWNQLLDEGEKACQEIFKQQQKVLKLWEVGV